VVENNSLLRKEKKTTTITKHPSIQNDEKTAKKHSNKTATEPSWFQLKPIFQPQSKQKN
jgi:hypothetical protein